MIEFGGLIYSLDLEKLENVISVNSRLPKIIVDTVKETTCDGKGNVLSVNTIETTRERESIIDSTKYDILRLMIDIITDDIEKNDDLLGAERALDNTTLSYRIAFNTLYKYKILKEE